MSASKARQERMLEQVLQIAGNSQSSILSTPANPFQTFLVYHLPYFPVYIPILLPIEPHPTPPQPPHPPLFTSGQTDKKADQSVSFCSIFAFFRSHVFRCHTHLMLSSVHYVSDGSIVISITGIWGALHGLSSCFFVDLPGLLIRITTLLGVLIWSLFVWTWIWIGLLDNLPPGNSPNFTVYKPG